MEINYEKNKSKKDFLGHNLNTPDFEAVQRRAGDSDKDLTFYKNS